MKAAIQNIFDVAAGVLLGLMIWRFIERSPRERVFIDDTPSPGPPPVRRGDYREPNMKPPRRPLSVAQSAAKWQQARMTCRECGQVWQAVAPVVAEYYECPGCEHMNPAPYLEGES